MNIKKASALTILAAIGITFAPIAPAQASDTQTIEFCHATGATDKYSKIDTSIEAVIKEGHENHAGDIIPSFTYKDVAGDLQSYAGSAAWNTDTGKEILGASCTVPLKVVTPVAPVWTPESCVLPIGSFVLAPQENVVVVSTPNTRAGSQWTAVVKPADGYIFPDGKTEQTFVQPISVFDIKSPACLLPDTGANSGLMTYGGIGAGVLVLGGLLMGANRALKRGI